MGATPKLIPKRKLISPTEDNQDVNNLLQHVLNNQQSVIPQVANAFTISGGTPTLNFVETDQTDPAGRWRIRGTANGLVIQRQLTASWATSVNALAFDPDNSRTDLTGPLASGLGGIYLICGASSTTQATLYLGTSSTSGLAVSTANASGTLTSRFAINTGVATATIDITGTVAIAGNITITGTTTIGTVLAPTYGQNLYLRANSAATQATEYSIYLQALNAASDTFLDMITVTPNGASPTLNFNSRAITSAGSMTFSTGSVLASGSTNGNTLLLKANDATFITFTTGTPDVCTIESPTMAGTWLASGTVTLPALTLGGTLSINGQTLSGAATFDGQIISTVAAGSPFLKANATSDVPTATWGAAAGNEVSAAPSGWLEIQDGSSNTRYIPFWA